MRLCSRRVCSSALTSSQYFRSRIPESTIAFSKPGASSRKRVVCSSVQNPITRSTPARLYQLRSKITTSPPAGRCGTYRCTYICVRSRSVGEGRATTRNTRGLHALGDGLDRAALARGVASLEDDADLGAGRLHPLLQGDELGVQLAQLGLVRLALHLRPGSGCSSAACCFFFFVSSWPSPNHLSPTARRVAGSIGNPTQDRGGHACLPERMLSRLLSRPRRPMSVRSDWCACRDATLTGQRHATDAGWTMGLMRQVQGWPRDRLAERVERGLVRDGARPGVPRPGRCR